MWLLFSHRYAKYYKENNVEKRTLIKAFGIRFDILVFGTVSLSFLWLSNCGCTEAWKLAATIRSWLRAIHLWNDRRKKCIWASSDEQTIWKNMEYDWGKIQISNLCLTIPGQAFATKPAGLEFSILLPHPSKCWDYRCASLHLIQRFRYFNTELGRWLRGWRASMRSSVQTLQNPGKRLGMAGHECL